MKLLMDGVWTLTKDHLKLLEATETFIKTHNYVSEKMIRNKCKIKASFSEILRDLIKLRFIQTNSDSYKLSISGFDCLAINSLRRKGLEMMGSMIGIGKESDIYFGKFDGKEVAIKVHRLGRSSFNRVESRGLKNEDNWFLANIESARNEAEYINLFSGPLVPKYYCTNRHMVVMELLDSYDTLFKVIVDNPAEISEQMLSFLKRTWDMGYAHGDFNEFNVMVAEKTIKVIDFPQCIPIKDPKAALYLKRDVECVHKYFWKKNKFICDDSMFKEIFEINGINIEIVRK
ncbi:Serine/threonine-protein kinase RIO2 [Glugoides intestinalis]